MASDTPQLREKQMEQLAFYIREKKCLDLSDPGTGKTPPCCVLAYFVSRREQGKTVWSMPKSLMKKNLKEMLRFTEFEKHEVEIMRTDRANLTQDWTGPTIKSTRRVAYWELEDGRKTNELRSNKRLRLLYLNTEGVEVELRTGKPPKQLKNPDAVVDYRVNPKRGPDGQPIKKWLDEPEEFKDLIQDAAQRGVKVFICTFAFLSAHWQRLMEAAPEIDLFLVDELHMGYGGPESQQTDSFYWVNKHCTRFVGMTGTLINGRLDTAFPAIHVIEPRYYGSYNGFIYDHAAMTDDYGRVTLWKNETKLRQIIERHSIARTFEEVYGKEDVVFFLEHIDVAEDVRESYDKFHEEAMLELEDGSIIDGGSPGVALIRARQLLNHPETMLKLKDEWTPKDEWVINELGNGRKTLLFASLQPEQERLLRLARSLGLRAELINANVNDKQRERIDEMAQAGELDVIVGSGPTVAVGFNWEMFDTVVFVSLDYMDTNILQAYRRASRGSRTTTLRVVFLRYKDTIERKIYTIVEKKSALANKIDPNRKLLTFEAYE